MSRSELVGGRVAVLVPDPCHTHQPRDLVVQRSARSATFQAEHTKKH